VIDQQRLVIKFSDYVGTLGRRQRIWDHIAQFLILFASCQSRVATAQVVLANARQVTSKLIKDHVWVISMWLDPRVIFLSLFFCKIFVESDLIRDLSLSWL
jgi:hypothetical protein